MRASDTNGRMSLSPQSSCCLLARMACSWCAHFGLHGWGRACDRRRFECALNLQLNVLATQRCFPQRVRYCSTSSSSSGPLNVVSRSSSCASVPVFDVASPGTAASNGTASKAVYIKAKTDRDDVMALAPVPVGSLSPKGARARLGTVISASSRCLPVPRCWHCRAMRRSIALSMIPS